MYLFIVLFLLGGVGWFARLLGKVFLAGVVTGILLCGMAVKAMFESGMIRVIGGG